MSILITGGARSGKSTFAEKLTMSLADQAVYIATGQAFDQEMGERIALHQLQRSESDYPWETIEEPIHLSSLLNDLSGERTVLVDCLTLWLSNLLLSVEKDENRQEIIEREISLLEQSVMSFNGKLIMVTNEVGNGIVPEYSLGRLYRDLAGRMNQRLARQCNQVFLVTAGIPIELKTREYIL